MYFDCLDCMRSGRSGHSVVLRTRLKSFGSQKMILVHHVFLQNICFAVLHVLARMLSPGEAFLCDGCKNKCHKALLSSHTIQQRSQPFVQGFAMRFDAETGIC